MGRGWARGCAAAPTHRHAGPFTSTSTSFVPSQAQRYIAQLKGQVNTLEAELEEQRKQKQKALVDNEQLRHERAQLQAAQRGGERAQGLREEAESAWPWLRPRPGGSWSRGGWALPCSGSQPPLPRREGHCHRGALHQAEGAAQQARGHARRAAQEGRAQPCEAALGGGDRPRWWQSMSAPACLQNADTAKQLTAKQQSQEEVTRVKEQLAFQMEQVKRESEMKVRPLCAQPQLWSPKPPVPVTHCPCDTSILSQLEEQSDQLEKLRRELETKAGELVRMQEALSRTEQVWGCWPGWSGTGGTS